MRRGILAIVLSGHWAAVFGFIFGLSAVRIKGFYLALTTIAAQTLFHFLIFLVFSSLSSHGLHDAVRLARVDFLARLLDLVEDGRVVGRRTALVGDDLGRLRVQADVVGFDS